MVVCDRLTKAGYFVPPVDEVSAAQAAKLFRQRVFAEHGAPREIIGDRDPRWMSDFWRQFFALTGSKLRFSTSFHPQTDGQTERTNQIF